MPYSQIINNENQITVLPEFLMITTVHNKETSEESLSSGIPIDVIASRTSLPTLVLNKQYMNNSKISRVLSSKHIYIEDKTQQIDIKIKDHIINIVDLWKDQNIQLSQQITQFDMAVMDAVYTIANNGYDVITAEWVVKVLSGNLSQKVTRQKLEAVRESIDKLRCIHIKIHCESEIKCRKSLNESIDQFVYESYLLPLDKAIAHYRANGKTVITYPILSKPALYAYAETTHQIIDIPASFLGTQKHFKDTDEAIIIKRYVLKRIAQMKSSKNNLSSCKISLLWYDQKHNPKGLYTELGYTPDVTDKWRTKTKPMITRIVKGTLSYLTEIGYIKGFSAYRQDGNNNPSSPIMGYEVIL
ncbi:hypothetical protein [Butyrivibrio sp. NC2007]|uniref:hypothetical protein n=1 Tax=Butyrivibrio sp. NC2007 TaxID=1280683 RepID=UPI0003B2EB68|nr:hypothetical protein [Butyrivibrio sp. NC2007]